MFAKAVVANVSHRELAPVLAGSNNTCLDTQVVYISCRNPVFLNLIRNKVFAKKNRFSVFKDILVSYQIQKFTSNMYSVSGKCRSILVSGNHSQLSMDIAPTGKQAPI